MIPISRIKRYL